MTRYLGVDYGRKRIGLAVATDDPPIASPLETLRGTGRPAADAEAVLAIVRREAADVVVVGLPLNMDDSVGSQARTTRRFIAALRDRTDRAIYEHDERLSTDTAESQLLDAGLTRTRRTAKRDKLAAAVILQAFLEGRASGAKGPSRGAPG